MKQPIISVCMPIFNGEQFVKQAITSALQQTFEDFELLIIDNGSTDKTCEIIQSFSDARIRLIRNKQNIGMVKNCNSCLEQAQGTYIHFLLHDDYWPDNCLEKKIAVFQQSPQVGLVFNASCVVDDRGIILMKRRPFTADTLFDGITLAGRSFARRNLFGEPSNVMFKKELVKTAGYFDERLCYSVDWDYWIRLSLLGQVYYIDDFLSYFRISKSSMTTSLFKTKDKLLLDDRQFIENCRRQQELSITAGAIFWHKINLYIRNCARHIFIALYAHDE